MQVKANQLNDSSQSAEAPEEQADDLTVIVFWKSRDCIFETDL